MSRRRLTCTVTALLAAALLICTATLSRPAGAAVQASGATSASGPWTGTWEGAPQRPNRGALDNVTVRLNVHVTIGGSAVRIRLDNTYGTHPVRIGAATVGIQAEGATVVPGTMQTLTFNGGRSGASVPVGGQLTSDGVPEIIPSNTNLSVSLYLPANTGPPTRHSVAHQDSYISTAGNHANDPTPLAYPTTTTEWFFLSGVDVENPGTSAVVTMGDSISDGSGSISNVPTTYFQLLFDRLQAAGGPYSDFSVLNAAIGGNELLHTSSCCYASTSGLARLNRDVADEPGAKDVIVLLGHNDIHGLNRATASEFIAGLRELISRAHARGVRVFGGTITPASNFTPAMNRTRGVINYWIRTSGAFDGVVDFASAVAASGNPNELNPAYNSGDGTHPNTAGYEAMANAVNLPDLLGYTYDDTVLNYSGRWGHVGASNHETHGDYRQTESWSSVPGATASFRFTGSGVELVGPKGANSGIADVRLDGKLAAVVDTYAPLTKEFQQDLFTFRYLTSGTHTLTVKVTGTKNPLSSGTGIAIDAVNINR